MGNELQPDDGPGQIVSGHAVGRQQQIRNPELRRHEPLRAVGRRDRQAGQQRSALSGQRKKRLPIPGFEPTTSGLVFFIRPLAPFPPT